MLFFLNSNKLICISRRRRPLVRHPNSIRTITNQGQGRGSILLPPRAAALPRLDASSSGV